MVPQSRLVPSPDPEMMLVPYRPGAKRKRRVRVVALALLVAGLAYTGGYWQGLRQNFHLLDQRSDLRTQVAELEKNLQQLQEETAVLRHGSEVERKASEQVRLENIKLQNRVSELKEAVSFYKGIMSPEGDARGLRIQRLELTQMPDAGRFRFKVVVTQVADNADAIAGTIRINLVGMREGVTETLSFDRIAADPATGEGLPFNFRFFQDISGEILVPAGFTPEQVEVIAQAKGRKAAKLDRRFDWKAREVTSDVGKG